MSQHNTLSVPERDGWFRRVLLGGFLLSGGFLVEGAGAARYYGAAVGASVAFCLLTLIVVQFFGTDRDELREPARSSLPWQARLLLGVFAAVWIARMVLDYRQLGLTGYGLKIAASYSTHLFVIFLLIHRRYFRVPTEALLAISTAVAIYGAANLVADIADIGPDRSHEQVERFSSRFDYVEERWLPPLAISNGSFSMLCAFAICICLRFAGYSAVPGLRRMCLYAIALLPILLWCSIKVQFRGVLLVAASGMIWAVLPWRIRPIMDMALLMMFPIVALSFIDLKAAEVLQGLVPAKLIAASGSSPEMFYTFSGRGYIWDYGFDLLNERETLLWGDGPAIRDATPGLLAAGLEEVGMTIGFHHSFVELLVAHGIFAAALVLGAMWKVVTRVSSDLLRIGARLPWKAETISMMVPLGAVAGGSLIDGPLGYLPILLIAFLPSAMAWRQGNVA